MSMLKTELIELLDLSPQDFEQQMQAADLPIKQVYCDDEADHIQQTLQPEANTHSPQEPLEFDEATALAPARFANNLVTIANNQLLALRQQRRQVARQFAVAVQQECTAEAFFGDVAIELSQLHPRQPDTAFGFAGNWAIAIKAAPIPQVTGYSPHAIAAACDNLP